MICWRRVFHRSSDTRQGFSSATDNHELGFVDEFYTDGRYVCTFERREYTFIRLLANTHGNTRNTERAKPLGRNLRRIDFTLLRSISTENLSFFHCAITTLLYRWSNNRRISDVLYIYIYLYALTFPLGVHVARRGFYVPRAISQSACSPSRASLYFSLGMVRSRSMGLTNGDQAVGGRGEVEGEWERVAAEGEEAARAEWRTRQRDDKPSRSTERECKRAVVKLLALETRAR